MLSRLLPSFVSSALCACFAWYCGRATSQPAAGQTQIVDKIRCRSLQVVNDHGAVVGEVSPDLLGNGALTLSNRDGKRIFAVAHGDFGQVGLGLMNSQGKPMATIEESAVGQPWSGGRLVLYDAEESVPGAFLMLRKDGAGELVFMKRGTQEFRTGASWDDARPRPPDRN